MQLLHRLKHDQQVRSQGPLRIPLEQRVELGRRLIEPPQHDQHPRQPHVALDQAALQGKFRGKLFRHPVEQWQVVQYLLQEPLPLLERRQLIQTQRQLDGGRAIFGIQILDPVAVMPAQHLEQSPPLLRVQRSRIEHRFRLGGQLLEGFPLRTAQFPAFIKNLGTCPIDQSLAVLQVRLQLARPFQMIIPTRQRQTRQNQSGDRNGPPKRPSSTPVPEFLMQAVGPGGNRSSLKKPVEVIRQFAGRAIAAARILPQALDHDRFQIWRNLGPQPAR